MTRSSVDFPQPDGPMSEMNSPRPTSRSMSCERGDAALAERLRDAARGDDGLGDAHTSCSGARWTTSFSTSTTTRKNAMPRSAATRFVAHRFSGVSA